jgi:hypothetical protein
MDSDELLDCDIFTEKVNGWLTEICRSLSCDSVVNTNVAKIQSTWRKDELATKLFDSLLYMKRQDDVLKKVLSLKNENDALKSKLIDSQQKVIGLQGELLASRTDQLETLQATVKTSVEDTVKAEFISYSAVVQNKPCVLEPERINTFVRQVVEDTDRSRSIMVFGLLDEANEKLCEKVGEVFGAIKENPRFEACRLGNWKQKKSDETPDTPRPVKVTLNSTSTAHHILAKAKNLRHCGDTYKSVFLCPDRTPEQRHKHRDLLQQLRTKEKETGKKLFIRNGTICSE